MNDFDGEQPDSVMNGGSEVLTSDDGLGLAATLRAVKTGREAVEESPTSTS